MKKDKQFSGFTLVEVLIMVGVLGVVIVVGSGLFLTILRSSTKARTEMEVKQSGNYALEVMTRMIRNSLSLEDCQPNMVKIKNQDQGETEFDCLNIGTIDGLVSSNSAKLTSDRVKVDSCTFNCTLGEAGLRPDEIIISFELSQKEAAYRPEEAVNLKFQSRITLRNY